MCAMTSSLCLSAARSVFTRRFLSPSLTQLHLTNNKRLSPMAKAFCTLTAHPMLSGRLSETDPELFDIIEKEKHRQRVGLVLIPSENFTSISVLDALGSVMQNKYSEGYPGARYYGGNEFIDQAELLCQKRALEAFDLDPEKWGVNVQCLSGSPANFEVYTAVLKPHDRLMALDLPHGGHLSHGYQTPTKKISAVSTYFECFPYRLNEATGLVDYDVLEKTSIFYRPKLLVGGASAYAREWDYARLKKIASKINALFMFDMAHISGLVAAKVVDNPFDYADIVTTTTHKSLRGPRGAMIFYRKGVRSVNKKGEEVQYNLHSRINASVFPGHQGGPHNHTISALATALKQANTSEFHEYQAQVLKNSKSLADALLDKGYDLVSGGTDNHLMLIDLRSKKIDGARVEEVLGLANISTNKNTVPGDKSAMMPSGLRVGSPALTTRGMTESDFVGIADLIDRGVKITQSIQKEGGFKKVKDFKSYLASNEVAEITELRNDVEQFARKFPVVGFDTETMKYQ
eukprot:587150_1